MGNTGSITAKAVIRPLLLPFTKWDKVEVMVMMGRATKQLSEIFATRKKEFDFLLGGYLLSDDDPEKMSWITLKHMYRDMFALFQARNGICDKFEILCSIILVSGIPSEMKIKLFFEIFNFNDKGYLLPTEIQMMLQCVTMGANKMDPQLPRPSRELVDKLVQRCIEDFAQVDRGGSIRKPEFVSFAAETREIQSFMDAWRGHASQVMTGGNKLWEDKWFLAADSSIVPSRDWLSVGLPPRGFVHWHRLPAVNGTDGSLVGCRALFNHTITFFRDVAKNSVYSGSGCVARGYLKQGYLSDRYLVNALSVLIARPAVIEQLFTTTEQEDIGRYQVKLFEGGGWRSVLIDDRVPCNDDATPAFLHSSDPYEGWPLLIQKALSKYWGSYGHFALNSARHDCILSTLRLLTGGHVFRRCTYEFLWKSADQTFLRVDGYRYIRYLLDEGSLVALGRSETRALEEPSGDNTPHGRLFPIVSMLDPSAESSYRYVVLRDAWNVVVSEDEAHAQGPEELSGHFRTFPVVLEDVPRMYDYMVVVRFPDVTRTAPRKAQSKLKLRGAKKTKEAPVWNTELRVAPTNGPSQPARFRLTVHEDPKVEARKVARAEAAAAAAARAAEEEAAVAAGQDPNNPLLTAGAVAALGAGSSQVNGPGSQGGKDQGGFPSGVTGGRGEDEGEDKPAESMFDVSGMLDTEDERLVDVALTLSSAVDWGVAGETAAAAEARLRVVPSGPTLAHMRRCRADLLLRAKELKRKRAVILAMLDEETGGDVDGGDVDRAAAEHDPHPDPHHHQDDEEDDEDDGENKNDPEGAHAAPSPKKGFKAFAKGKHAPAHSPGRTHPPALLLLTEGEGEGEEKTDLELAAEEDPEVDEFDAIEVHSFSQQGSWLSTDFLRLLPGVYYVYGDVDFEPTIEELRVGLKLHADATDTPWKEESDYGSLAVWLEASSRCKIHLEVVTPEEVSRLAGALQLPPPPPRQPVVVASDEHVTNGDIEGYLTRLKKARKKGDPEVIKMVQGKVENARAAAREALRVQREAAAEEAEAAALRAIAEADGLPVDVDDMDVPPPCWPFAVETQSDAATRGLEGKMGHLREEAERLAAQFIDAAQQLKAAKQRLRSTTVMLRVPE